MRHSDRRYTRSRDEDGPESVSRSHGLEPSHDGSEGHQVGRRRLLVASGALLAGSALSIPASAADSNHYELGARTSHWEGEEPSDVEGVENPTLSMTPGEEYTVTWHNRDGNYHKLLIRDEDSNVLESTSGNNEQGGTESVTFVATAEMDNYQCEPHYPMRGDIETGEDSTTTPTPTETESQPVADESTATETGTDTSEEPATATATEARTPTESAATETATETPSGTASEATGTASDEASQTDGGTEATTDSATAEGGDGVGPDEQSVFGVGSAVVGAGGVIYLLRERFAGGDD